MRLLSTEDREGREYANGKVDFDCGTRKDKYVHFYICYLLVLEERYTDEQASRVRYNR
jgi:hypothetical protein